MLLYLAALAIFVIVLLTISSRIRKVARSAFEPETIETGEFVIVKPEGFLNPLNEKSQYAFEAYSKEFGTGDTENSRRAEIFVSAFPKENFDSERETEESDTAYNFYKTIEGEKLFYRLKFSVLKDFLEDYKVRVDETLESFSIR